VQLLKQQADQKLWRMKGQPLRALTLRTARMTRHASYRSYVMSTLDSHEFARRFNEPHFRATR
jgi:hypothetical protein